jgi:hypothetical protein
MRPALAYLIICGECFANQANERDVVNLCVSFGPRFEGNDWIGI